jgi:Lamin Tail Domain
MLRRLVVLVAATILLAAVPATAQGEILISFIRYNPPGPDTGSNASLNGEWVTIHNNGRHAKALTAWRLHDNQHHRFTFPAFSLCGGCSVRVHTGSGTNGTASLYWGFGNYIWNNTGDRATLVKPTGVIRDTCAYVGSSLGYKKC